MEYRHALDVGTRLDEFEIVGVLGAGGFGVTYLAKDVNLSSLRVIKEFYPSHLVERDTSRRVTVRSREEEPQFESGLRSFLREAQVAASLAHPNICRVLRYFEANGTGYFAMEYSEGETLGARLQRSDGPPSEEELLDAILPILDALEYIHSRSLVHRDVKPANIFLRTVGGPLLIDFGAARQATKGTRPLTAILTPGYAPPEQYGGDTAQGPYTDIYAIGAVMYRMVSGKDLVDAFTRCQSSGGAYVSAASVAKGSYRSEILDAIDRSVRLTATERFATVAELRGSMLGRSASVAATPTVAPPASTGDKRVATGVRERAAGRRPLALTVGVVLALAVALGFWRLGNGGKSSDAEQTTGPAVAPKTAGSAPIATPAPDTTPKANPAPTVDPAVDTAQNPALLTLDSVVAGLPPRQIDVQAWIEPKKDAYSEGEQIQLGYTVMEDAYVAVVVYSSDRTATLVYPNQFAKGILSKARQAMLVGGAENPFRIEVAPPFGIDVVHVIAFRRFEDLTRTLRGALAERVGQYYRINTEQLTRGVKVIGASSTAPSNSGPSRWGDSHVLIRSIARSGK